MTESWDVVVVGSGPGGLTAAAALAASGRRVLVLERHDVAGGNATVFRRHHEGAEYEFDVGVHYIGSCAPGGLISSVFASLGVGDRMEYRPLDPDGFDTLVYPGAEVRVPADWDLYRERLTEACPRDRAGIERSLDVLRTVAREFQARQLPGAETPTYDEWAMRPLSDLFSECELSPLATALLDHWSGLYAGPPSQSTVAMHALIIDHYMAGAYFPAGGGQMMSARLIQVIEARGGEVRALTPVDEIVVESRRVRGVRLAGGEVIEAPLVISNADHTRTVRHLVAREHWNPGTLAFVDQAVMTLGLVCVYVVVDTEFANLPNTNYHVWPTTDVEGVYSALDAGDFGEGDPFLYLAFASVKDPGNAHLCPPGHTNFQIMTLAPRGHEAWGVDTDPGEGGRYRREASYRAAKEALTDRMITAAEKILGPFRDHIVHLETATPMTHERYVASTGGTSYGYLHSPEQSGDRRPQHRTEIEGLWLTGANTVSGHGIAGAMVGGVTCAGQILDRPLLVEMILGTQLLDPATVPPDPPDFDPLEYSRGARLRAKRAARRERAAAG